MIIVTLSGVCTLKCTCQYTLFDVEGVEIHEYKRSRYSIDFNVLKAMYVKDGICGFYTTLHTENCYSSHLTHVKGVKDVKYYCALYTVASCPCQQGRLFVTLFGKPSVLEV